jgi:hypothetical protein
MKTRVIMLLGASILLGAGLAAACSEETNTDDLEARIAAVEQQQTAIQEQIQIVAMRTALDTLDNAGLHAIDEGANDEGTIVSGAAGGVSRAIQAMAATDWPDDLQADADALLATLQELHEALESEDPAVVGPPASEAHEAQHSFSDAARSHIAEAVGLPVEEHEEESETPAAGETPAGDETPEEGG